MIWFLSANTCTGTGTSSSNCPDGPGGPYTCLNGYCQPTQCTGNVGCPAGRTCNGNSCIVGKLLVYHPLILFPTLMPRWINFSAFMELRWIAWDSIQWGIQGEFPNMYILRHSTIPLPIHPFLSPPVHVAWWDHRRHFLSVCLSVCLSWPQATCWLLGSSVQPWNWFSGK